MNQLLESLFSGNGFMPHGHCYLWSSGLIGLHAVSDSLIVLAYYSIPVGLVYFARKRKDIKFEAIFIAFAVFILACGTTHLMEVWNIWHSDYWLAGTVKFVTAVSSILTAIALFRMIPMALKIPSPSALERVNLELQEQIRTRREAEEKARELAAELEVRVEERTAELHEANLKLRSQIEERARIEDQLRESLKEVTDLKAALDEHAIVAITDPQGRITYVNDKFCAISKFSRQELLGQDHRIINSSFHPKEFIRGIWQTIGSGRVWHGEIKNRAKDGSYYWVDTTIVPMLDANGKPRQYIAIRNDITSRKAAEKAAAQLAAIVEYSEDAIVGKNLAGVVTSWNSGAERLFGYAASEMIGQRMESLIPPERREAEEQILERVRQGKNVSHFETLRVRKGGEVFHVSTTISAIKDRAGNVVGSSNVARDISDRKRVEEELRQSLKEVTDLKAAMDEHAIVAITDPQGRITYVNDKFCAISQYSREELLGQDHRIINSGYHPKEFIRGLWRTIGSGKVWHGEIKNRAKDGSYYWVDTTIVPFLNDQGKPRQYVAIRNDITERKRALEALAESEEQFHTMADAIPQLAWMAQPDGSIFWYNQRWYDYTGATPAEMEGGGWEKVHHPQWLPEVRKKWKSSVAEGKRFEMDFPLRGADGDYRWFLTRVVPLKDSSGRVLRWFGTNTDVSEMRRAEQEIQRLNSELEQRVQIRTAELEAANKELEAFSYTISHDLRAPLRAVDGFSQAVLQDFGRLLPTEGHRYLQVIRSGAQNMGMLIDDLLTFSRLSRTALNKQMVDMSRLVGSTLSELDPLKQGRDIVVRQSELPPCLGDPALLKQVWVNLLSNAFKYTQKRAQAVVEIGSEAGAEGETAVYFVRDNGTGFNMKYVDKLFGVFQRLHRAEDFEGTGVGLAIVQRVIQRHGGRIWAKAEVDHGATFFFTLQEKNQPKDPS